jgi:hypothetical protein
MPWSTPFDDPIPLPGGRELVTFEDAAGYVVKLKKSERDKPHWQLAGKILIQAAEGRDFPMHARIAMLQAIHHNEAPVFKTDRKETHWGKRKLKRDE